MAQLKLRESELLYTGTFDAPVLDVYFMWGQLFKAALSRLGPLGATPGNLRWEGNHPTEFVLNCWLLNFRAALKFRVGSFEVWTNDEALSEKTEAVGALISAALETVKDIAPKASVGAHRILATVHFDVTGEGIRERVGRYVSRSPEGPANLLACGIVFTSDLDLGGRALVRLEPSERFKEPQCGFLGVECSYPGAASDGDALLGARAFYRSVPETLGLVAKE